MWEGDVEITFIVIIGLLNVLLGLSTALFWVVGAIGRVIAREREMRPQTRYFVG